MFENTSKLIVWRKAHALVLAIYDIYEMTKKFPKEEQFSLTSQIRRVAMSIPSNIVEGKARGSSKEYKRFLLMSRGSLEEVKFHLLLGKDLGYIDLDEYESMCVKTDEVGKLLNGLIRKVR